LNAIQAVASPASSRSPPAPPVQTDLGLQLTRHCRGQLGLRQMTVRAFDGRLDATKPHLVGIAFREDRIEVLCEAASAARKPDDVFHRLAGVLSVVAGVDSLRRAGAVADISDGEESGAGVISFCSRESDAILIPDHIFVRTRGYEAERALARRRITPWEERSDRIVWRGSTTGTGLISKPQLSTDDRELIARVRLCLALKDVQGTDAKLSGITQSVDKGLDHARLGKAGVLGELISPICWYGLKFAIDIDGNSNAWSNFFTRLVMGCCVLKVGSPAGYRQWYYADLEPWAHFVPVRADLSDLHEQIAWCRANSAACRDIAARGQEFAMAHDFSTEMTSARARIREANMGGGLRALHELGVAAEMSPRGAIAGVRDA
jgi:hypothetical protein